MTGVTALRILIVSGIFPPDIGGPATYVPQIATALVNRGHQVTVLTLSDRLDHDDRDYRFCLRRLARKSFKLWRWLRTIAQIIGLGRRADVLFVNGLALETVLANVWLRKPLIQKVVGDLAWEQAINRGWLTDSFEVFQERRYKLKVQGLKALRAWWTRRADYVIVPSHYLARRIVQWGVSEARIVVIHNALEPFDSIQPAEVPLQSPLKVITVGRLIPLKRVDKVMEAIAKCDGVGLVIVGDGSERRRLEELVPAYGLANRVYFAGVRSKAETLALMAACDLFVLNSTHEAFPHVLLEAMSLGLPAIATAVGGIPEIVKDGENGRLVPPADEGMLYEVLLKLVSSPLERRRLSSGAQDTIQRFSPRPMLQRTEAVLRKSACTRTG
ncbi:MAG TPA: glycosyltransferase family 4 protein [Candidatus Tectomicrobia bacterium]|nr:glycosyltransferase family 4 protein [Candidatus Tectomicrobia bacterium]